MKQLRCDFTRERIFPGFDKKTCKIDPKIITDGKDRAVLFYGMLLLSGSDVGTGSYAARSTDGGRTFGTPVKLEGLTRYEGDIRVQTGPCVSGIYDEKSGKALLFGLESRFADDKNPIMINGISTCKAVYATFDMDDLRVDPPFRPMPLPLPVVSAVPHGQPMRLSNGHILASFYFTTEEITRASILTAEYAFEEGELTLIRAGEPLISGDDHLRGYCEPSVAKCGGKYYMTIRTDEVGLYAVSDDGFTFGKPQEWRWDDGTVLENYNTMQRFLVHPEGLYLAYTRRGAHNDHVFRHRAPMFFARFDEERQVLLRETEEILVPEMGARLGNFSVTPVSERENWLVTAEWMQPLGCERYGSDNSIWIARVKWEE